MTTSGAGLAAVLEQARSLGFLGPGAIEPHIAHAGGFAAAIEATLGGPPRSLADLGSGGGVPGLVLAARWPAAQVTLIESMRRRADFLREAVMQLGFELVSVERDRAESLAHRPDVREHFDVVTARGFADPAVTAEIAAGFAAPGGILVVSEPPEPRPDRWPAHECAELGFGPATFLASTGHFAVLRKLHAAPPDVPRAVGRPAKRPRW